MGVGGGPFSNVHFFHKKVPFLANIECCPKFLEYALLVLSIKLFEFFFKMSFRNIWIFAHETGRKSSSNPAKSNSNNQCKICSKFQRCI